MNVLFAILYIAAPLAVVGVAFLLHCRIRETKKQGGKECFALSAGNGMQAMCWFFQMAFSAFLSAMAFRDSTLSAGSGTLWLLAAMIPSVGIWACLCKQIVVAPEKITVFSIFGKQHEVPIGRISGILVTKKGGMWSMEGYLGAQKIFFAQSHQRNFARFAQLLVDKGVKNLSPQS